MALPQGPRASVLPYCARPRSRLPPPSASTASACAFSKTDEDIARIAGHLSIAQDEFIAATSNETRKRRAIDKPDFALSTINHANNAVVCPAVFYLVEQMKRRLRW
jgi:hypothetical protein